MAAASGPAGARRTVLALIGPLVGARTVILTGSAVRSRRMAQFIAEAGARPVPLDLGRLPTDTRARFAACERQLSDPPSAFQRRLDIEDPDGTALIYAGSFTAVSDVCGRRVIGCRSARHLAAERKDRQLELMGSHGEIIDLSDGLVGLCPLPWCKEFRTTGSRWPPATPTSSRDHPASTAQRNSWRNCARTAAA